MESKTPFVSGVWRGRSIVCVLAMLCAMSVLAADALFPQPLHLVRQVEDPLSGKTTTLHEYCAGDQVVTVNGAHVVIADYAKQQLIEIDRDAGTYSVTRFDELAKTNTAAPKSEWKAAPLGMKAARSGRSVDSFELTTNHEKLEIGVDRLTHLSRAAVEVLIGASYPNAHREEHDAILRAAGNARRGGDRGAVANAADAADYALPVEQTLTIDEDGERLTVRNSVVEVRNDLAPDDVRMIPPGARLVESRATRLARELRDIDHVH